MINLKFDDELLKFYKKTKLQHRSYIVDTWHICYPIWRCR
jgi:hypothetical protein